ncbi:hypothetical protein GCM10018787_01400 [Streptomyces thermodiastaticus]|nr:hypothetical protein GCM10018787_01400 [Streptomyces thermodiastaticus]
MPDEARRHVRTEEERQLVADRVETQVTGSPGRVADQLEQPQEATDADEPLITTITPTGCAPTAAGRGMAAPPLSTARCGRPDRHPDGAVTLPREVAAPSGPPVPDRGRRAHRQPAVAAVTPACRRPVPGA